MSDYLDHELREQPRRRLERHAADCPECGPELRALERTVVALGGLRHRPARSVAPAVIEVLRLEQALREERWPPGR
jgi:anti-sigma factor RsiW